MTVPTFLLGVALSAASVSAQDPAIPQNLPLSLRQTSDTVRRKVEQPIPQNLPLQQPTNRPYSGGLLNRLRTANTQTVGMDNRVKAGSVEDRIAALEAKVQSLQREVETQKAMIERLKELLDQQQKKN